MSLANKVAERFVRIARGEAERYGAEADESEQNDAKQTSEGKGKARESMYVSLVESERVSIYDCCQKVLINLGMVRTVLEHESFLLSQEELAFFNAYSSLSCKPLYSKISF